MVSDLVSIDNERIEDGVVSGENKRSSNIDFDVRLAPKEINVFPKFIDLRLTDLHVLIFKFLKPVGYHVENIGAWIGRLYNGDCERLCKNYGCHSWIVFQSGAVSDFVLSKCGPITLRENLKNPLLL